jgi:mono/diheme cytochrome c family protein
MPIMPFDDSKFYALTYMLDMLGRRNRDRLRTVWNHRGFSPEKAFEIHCSQCHGQFLQGNGPVAEWIYPIPKNLRNAYFLRNLTKERVIQSIRHGVKGTPMPPWNETPIDKPHFDGIPILTESEIKQLVDWIFSVLPGGTVIRGPEDVPKWNYTPQDVLDELRREGNEFKLLPQKPTNDTSFHFFMGEEFFAALQPAVAVPAVEVINPLVEKVFNIVPNPTGPDKYSYYIKKDYYTDDNIETGRRFFEMNCAVCHGKEGDGTGVRAEVMQDAKPRMFTNLDWGNTRDDLRLLRSIKYGVPGTAMTPWGDVTSSLQRIQLVIFIRNLNENREKKEQLDSALYRAFDREESIVEDARIIEYPAVEKVQDQIDDIESRENSLYDQVRAGRASPQEAAELYQKKLNLLVQLEQLQSKDKLLMDLKNLIAKEGEIYKNIGLLLMSHEPAENSWSTFLEMIDLNQGRFLYSNQTLSMSDRSEKKKQIEFLKEKLSRQIDAKIRALEQEETGDKEQIVNEIKNNSKLKNALISGLQEIERLQIQEQSLLNRYVEHSRDRVRGAISPRIAG